MTRFASLTATLLARKGEAVPAAESLEQMTVPPRADMRRLGLDSEQQGRLNALLNERSVKEEAMEDRDQKNTDKEARKGSLFGPQSQGQLGTKPVQRQSAEVSNHSERNPPSGEADREPAAPPVSLVVPNSLWPTHRTLKKRTAVTLRLDEASYLRLKYAGARLHRTNQDILSAALDVYLENLGSEYFEACQWVHDYKEN